MMNQKELKEKYMNIIKAEVWQNDEHMQEYARKECEYVIELSNGNIIDIDKPRIEKNFCFGMGMYATYTDEEFERAEGMAEKARTDVNYFIWNIGENMGTDEYIPICEDLQPEDKDRYDINASTLKAIKLSREEVETLREAAHIGIVSKKTAEKALKSKRTGYNADRKRKAATATIDIFKRITA